MKKISEIIVIFFIALLIFSVIWLFWTLGRQIKYQFAYQDQVKKEIINNVKVECLK